MPNREGRRKWTDLRLVKTPRMDGRMIPFHTQRCTTFGGGGRRRIERPCNRLTAGALPVVVPWSKAVQKTPDPGDAVPEGVAVEQPVPLTPEEEAVKRKLEELPDSAQKRREQK